MKREEHKAEALLGGIAGHAREMNTLVGEMAANGRDHAVRVESINSAMAEMAPVTRDSAGRSEDTAQDSQSFSAHSGELEQCVRSLNGLVEGR